MSERRRRGGAARPWWLWALVVLLVAGVLRLGWDLLTHWQELRAGDGLRFGLLLALRATALAAGVATLPLAWLRRPRHRPPWTPRLELEIVVRGLAAVLLGALVAASLVHWVCDLDGDRFAARSAFSSALLLAASLWLALLLAMPERMIPARRGFRRLVSLACVNLLLALLLVEGVVRAFASAYPTWLLWKRDSIRSVVEANRLEPGQPFLGTPANSGGYHDQEFFRAGPGDYVVALLADSFGVGVVPHRHHFATVAERRLRAALRLPGRVAVHNFGVASIGLPEYAWLLENEVPAIAPHRVLVGLFVGNDLSGLAGRAEPGHYSLQQLELFDLGRRLAALFRESARGGLPRTPPVGRMPGPEVATFGVETFLDIERAAIESANSRDPAVDRLYDSAFAWLERMHRRAGDRLLVLLIPDEFQVNDQLWAELMRRVEEPAAYDRWRPQDRLTAFCRARGIEVLDLLEPLRHANRERPVYRLRDTHWNARGNRIAGELVAERLLEGRRRQARGRGPNDAP